MNDASNPAGTVGAPPTVLIVDDVPENLTVLGELLQPAYRVLAARSGAQALEIAARQPPDLILLDVLMPGMDGYMVLARLRAAPATAEVPVIFVTALDDTADEQRGLDLGAADYLTKPLRPPVVLARVRNQLDLRQAMAQMRSHGEALERMVHDLEAFSYTVSHDLRAPLRAINGFAEMIRETDAERLSQESRQLLERIVANSIRMGDMMDDILDYSRAERAKMEAAPLDLGRLAAEVVKDLAEGYPAARVSVGPLPTVRADRTMLKQVFANLIGNALKYSAKRDAPVVEIGMRDTPRGREIFVRDNGTGFDMRYAGKLFGMFQRMHGHQEFSGTGIGLAIVKRLVERHGGTIRAEAAPERGATFSFTLGE
jgi:signal transduction histidine kinase